MTRYIKVTTGGVPRKVKPPASQAKVGLGAIATTGATTDGETIIYDLSTDTWIVGDAVTDHGVLTGLTDDDHGQYLTTARHADIDHDSPYTEHLLDTTRITNSGLTLSVNAPTKDAGNPLFPTSAEATGAWDRTKGYTSVVKTDDGWHMFYTGFDTGGTARTGYASSTDGVAWTKPNLGLVTYDGNTNNNILRTGFCNHAIYDPTSAKWIQVEEEAALGGDIFLYTSDSPNVAPTLVKTITTGTGNGEGKGIVRRPSDGRWVLYYTAKHASSDRSTYAIVSDTTDLTGTWTEYGIILDASASTAQIYSVIPSLVGDQILYCLHRYNSTSEQVDTELYESRNGIDLTQVLDPLIALGTSTAWDDEQVYGNSLVVEDDEWHIYYSGQPVDHATANGDSRIGRVTIGRERMGQGTGTGTITTDYMQVSPGATLRVNANGSGGSVKVEVQDLDGAAVTGFATADFDSITTDDYDHYATWGQETIPAGTYRMVFTLTSATLYGFEISDASDAVTTGGGASAFDDLTDVALTGFAGGQGVFYRASSSLWENARAPEPLTDETPAVLFLEDGSVAMSEPFFD